MSEHWNRKYPVGNDDFVSLRRNGEVYVDKTELIWQMIQLSRWIFLSRPRRFGKTLLTSTLKAFFEGRKELFEGLAISEHEKEWTKYPVLQFNLSVLKDLEVEEMRSRIGMQLEYYEEIYGRNKGEQTPGARLEGLIKRAYKQTGLGVVLIFDEYDTPMLSKLDDPDALDKTRTIMQEFYNPIKSCSAYERFTFITGITNLSQFDITDTLNNFSHISMLPKFAALTGFTDEELDTVFHSDIERLAATSGVSFEEMREIICKTYYGYCFSESKEGVYNPFTILKAFDKQELNNYWLDSVKQTLLLDVLKLYRIDVSRLFNLYASKSTFYCPVEMMTSAVPLLYQSGYLTIKDYDSESQLYHLSIPNQEVMAKLSEKPLS